MTEPNGNGSRDNNPPVMLFPDDYEFAAIGHPGNNFAVYCSRQSGITKLEIVARLRDIANHIEASEKQL